MFRQLPVEPLMVFSETSLRLGGSEYAPLEIFKTSRTKIHLPVFWAPQN